MERLDVKEYCGRWAWKSPDGETFPFYCGSASCGREICKRKYYTRRLRLVQALIQEHELSRFFTLTVDRSETVDVAWESIVYTWHKFRSQLKRIYGGMKYVAVMEEHKDGYPHIHGFTNIWMSQKQWSEKWSKSGGGKIVDVRLVTGDPGEYVAKELHAAKYVGKQNLLNAKSRLEPRKRTLWRSKNTKAGFELDERDSDWVLLKETVYKVDDEA